MPSWCSVTLILRVPNRMANSASAAAVTSAVSIAVSPLGVVVGNDIEAGNNRLELQRNVRHRSNRCDQRHDHGEAARFAVARRNEVRDRRQVLPLADRHHAGNDAPAEHEHEYRAQIDRQVQPAVDRRAADCAVERPRGGVYAQRQAVDQGAQFRRQSLRPDPVSPARYGKQETDVEDGQEQQSPPVDQTYPPFSRPPSDSLSSGSESTTLVVTGRIGFYPALSRRFFPSA